MKRISLTKGKFALVDDQDYERISKYKWCSANQGGIEYAVRSSDSSKGKKKELIYMHKEILGLGRKQLIDHVSSKDSLNNCRSNLRPCTNSQNMMNRRKQKGVTSKYKGVSWDSVNKKWRAQISKDFRDYSLGRHDSEKDAATFYNIAAQFLFGDFALLNPI